MTELNENWRNGLGILIIVLNVVFVIAAVFLYLRIYMDEGR